MNIQHLINGRAVDSAEHFDTINPATQTSIASVAAGGEAEINAAVAAAKAAFPKWAATPATERAKIIRKLGDLIAKEAPTIAQWETQDTGQVIAQTGKQLIPEILAHPRTDASGRTRTCAHRRAAGSGRTADAGPCRDAGRFACDDRRGLLHLKTAAAPGRAPAVLLRQPYPRFPRCARWWRSCRA